MSRFLRGCARWSNKVLKSIQSAVQQDLQQLWMASNCKVAKTARLMVFKLIIATSKT